MVNLKTLATSHQSGVSNVFDSNLISCEIVSEILISKYYNIIIMINNQFILNRSMECLIFT